MRNTNNGQTSDFTDFVRAVTRNRDNLAWPNDAVTQLAVASTGRQLLVFNLYNINDLST